VIKRQVIRLVVLQAVAAVVAISQVQVSTSERWRLCEAVRIIHKKTVTLKLVSRISMKALNHHATLSSATKVRHQTITVIMSTYVHQLAASQQG
jgi:hypothetical protein